MSELADKIREMFKKGDDVRDAGLTTPVGIVRDDDILYGTDETWEKLDVYRPDQAVKEKRKLPVIVSVHGGGWVYGDKERYQYYCMELAGNGFAVVNFTYRLAPEFQFPSSIEDTGLVFQWVLTHADEYGFDTGNIFAVGDSAGAHGLGIYLNLLTNPAQREKTEAWINRTAPNIRIPLPEELNIRAAGLFSGQYQLKMNSQTSELTIGLMKDYLPGGGTAEELELIDVAGHVTNAFPPVFLMTATGDFLIGQAPIMANALMQAKVPFEFHFYVNENGEDLGHVFHLNIREEHAKQCNQETCAFFRKYLETSPDNR